MTAQKSRFEATIEKFLLEKPKRISEVNTRITKSDWVLWKTVIDSKRLASTHRDTEIFISRNYSSGVAMSPILKFGSKLSIEDFFVYFKWNERRSIS